MEFSEPSCGKCRWQVQARAPALYGQVGPVIGIKIVGGVHLGYGEWREGIGAHYCEHPSQPRGLVLTNYSCRNFERPPKLESELQITE